MHVRSECVDKYEAALASAIRQGAQRSFACFEQVQVMELHGMLQLELVHAQRAILGVVDKVLGGLRVGRISSQAPSGLAKRLREQMLHKYNDATRRHASRTVPSN